MLLRPALLALLGLALAVPAAQARTVHARVVDTADHQTTCYALIPLAGRGIECSSAHLPDTGELDPYVALAAHGRSALGERGDYPGYAGPRRTVRAGDRWRHQGVTCRFTAATTTCRNRDGHGFRLGPRGVRRF